MFDFLKNKEDDPKPEKRPAIILEDAPISNFPEAEPEKI